MSRIQARLGRAIPDIEWVEVPGGPFRYGEKSRKLTLPTFFIARYAVTHGQFQCFIDDPSGFRDARWWEGVAKRYEQPAEPGWTYSNHPRETVSWYEAVAFCRWFSDVVGYEVRLPTEQEWEKAARGTDGREFPWGGFEPGHANINEIWGDAGPHNLGQTSAMGIYPHGASPFDVLDLAGNVWEWCLNKYDSPKDVALGGDARRVVRGGSWLSNRGYARCAYRDLIRPGNRNFSIGFRVVCVSPII